MQLRCYCCDVGDAYMGRSQKLCTKTVTLVAIQNALEILIIVICKFTQSLCSIASDKLKKRHILQY